MNKDKKMKERILNHILEIIYLLSGEASFLQQLTNSMKRMNVIMDKKMTEKVLNHALEIIYLLTGEEYTIVKKNSHGIHRHPRKCGKGRHKETRDENHQTLGALELPTNKSSGLKDEKVDNICEEGEDEVDEKDILKVTIHSDLCAEPSNMETSVVLELGHQQIKEEEIPIDINEGRENENLCIVSINNEGEYESEEEDTHGTEISEDGSVNKKMLQSSHTDVFVSNRIIEKDSSLSLCSVEESERNSLKESALCIKGNLPSTSMLCRQTSCDKFAKDCCIVPGRTNRFKRKESTHFAKEISGVETGEHPQTSPTGETSHEMNKNSEKITFKTKLVVSPNGTLREKKLHPCSYCEKCFIRRTHLIIHQRTHTGEKPYICNKCGRSFSQKSTLVTHHRIHTGEKPYICSECGKCFSDRSNLVAHNKTHRSEKPYICPECGKCFTAKSNLVKHQRTHIA